MTYNVFGGMLNLAQSINQDPFRQCTVPYVVASLIEQSVAVFTTLCNCTNCSLQKLKTCSVHSGLCGAIRLGKVNVHCIVPHCEHTSKALRYGTCSQGICTPHIHPLTE